MPTRDRQAALDPDGVRRVVAERCFPDPVPGGPRPGRIGLEVERFPVRVGPGGRPSGRLVLEGSGPSSTAVLDGLARRGRGISERCEVVGLPAYPIVGGGRLTFEPGGQLEHVTAAHPTAAGALAELSVVSPPVAEAFDEAGVALVSAGLDVWHPVDRVPLQLWSFRYPAMDAYLAGRGSFGATMMRHTCSLQISVDGGLTEPERDERWLLSNLLAPLLTATFAVSPGRESVCERARAWQHLDPTRTGFPRLLTATRAVDPVEQLADAALGADVLLVRTQAGAVPGRRGFTFDTWMRDGHPDHGYPTDDDLAYHLSTLFHEVRPRGVLELRSIDAVPPPWRAVPVALVAGALEDDRARGRLLELLARHRTSLPAMWRQAAVAGVGDPAACALAVEAWSYAYEGATRLPATYLPSGALREVEEYLERFTLRGRCPADELRERLAAGPETALAWASEPVPNRAGVGG